MDTVKLRSVTVVNTFAFSKITQKIRARISKFLVVKLLGYNCVFGKLSSVDSKIAIRDLIIMCTFKYVSRFRSDVVKLRVS